MKSVTVKKAGVILFSVVCIFIRCSDKQPEIRNRVILSNSERQQILISGGRLNSFFASFGSAPQAAQDLKNRLNVKNAMTQYINSISDSDEKSFTLEVINYPEIKNLLDWYDPSISQASRAKDLHSPFENLSASMRDATDNKIILTP